MARMALAALLAHYKNLHRQQLEIEAELNAVEREILATESVSDRVESTPKLKRDPRPKSHSKTMSPATREMARATLTAIRAVGAGHPTCRRDVAEHLGLSDSGITYRLQILQAMGFVERVANDRYRVVDIVPDLADA